MFWFKEKKFSGMAPVKAAGASDEGPSWPCCRGTDPVELVADGC
jgi:hypothetical protein